MTFDRTEFSLFLKGLVELVRHTTASPFCNKGYRHCHFYLQPKAKDTLELLELLFCYFLDFLFYSITHSLSNSQPLFLLLSFVSLPLFLSNYLSIYIYPGASISLVNSQAVWPDWAIFESYFYKFCYKCPKNLTTF